ncbi:MAG: tRNA (guanine(10)-N(2))-dimethyltransferase [Candidatus Aenigmarchaeota archaeon]|nr:tRNA (guanine(10)-N(2))-dimethyltransferase [Candidatus Aenigmarchaeota archaeon]
MRLKEVLEGKVRLKVPDVEKPEEGEVFYNPVMSYDRNISVGVLKLLKNVLNKPEDKLTVLDALSATGVRALRYKKEVGVNSWANDVNPKSVDLIKENAALNKIKIKVTREDANIILRKNKFDYVDIDPFGSPVPFLDSTAKSFLREGFLSITATDTAPLCGTYPKVSLRRYGIESFKSDYYNELGIRILISEVIKTFAKYEKVFIPQLSYSRRHYFRVYGKVETGVKKVNNFLEKFGFVSHCFNCGWRDLGLKETCPMCGAKTKFTNVYLGDIQNKSFLKDLLIVLDEMGFEKEKKLIEIIKNEASVPFYFDTHYIAEKTGKAIRKIDDFIKKLKENGFSATKTHFCPTAVKTDAKFSDVVEIF